MLGENRKPFDTGISQEANLLANALEGQLKRTEEMSDEEMQLQQDRYLAQSVVWHENQKSVQHGFIEFGLIAGAGFVVALIAGRYLLG